MDSETTTKQPMDLPVRQGRVVRRIGHYGRPGAAGGGLWVAKAWVPRRGAGRSGGEWVIAPAEGNPCSTGDTQVDEYEVYCTREDNPGVTW